MTTRTLLLAVNGLALIVPIAVVLGLRVFDDQLIRRTEAQLIGQGVLIAEAWREAWLREMGMDPDQAPRYAPEAAGDARYFPIEPQLTLGGGVLPPAVEPKREAHERNGPAWAAGAAVQSVLTRAVRMNLASARVLDTDACVVASSGAERGRCYDLSPEIAAALSGRYASVLRHRVPVEPVPALESISRRSRVRVYVAIPVLSDGEVVAVVRMARTALDPAKALWFDRARLLVALSLCVLFTSAVTLFLSRTIARPLRAITAAARGIANGEGRTPFDAPRLAPRELREVSTALDRMTSQLSDRAEYISEFATNVSHELKTPIAGIRGAAELLDESWSSMSDDERNRFLCNIRKDAARMERLVTRLLHLARIQSAPERADEVDLSALLDRLATGYGDDVVRVRRGAAPTRLRVQEDHLESAVRNLLDNAVRHGRGRPVDLEAEKRGERIAIRVRDRGPGISAGNRERVFDRFFTTERDHGGTGLGLAIARAVAETRGGSLQFETSANGTCFELVL